jgi:hypothetical protein
LLNLYNEFEITASAREIDRFTDICLQLAEVSFFKFTLRDITEINWWQSMIAI